MKIEVEITEAQAFALDLVIGNKSAWAGNALTNRARKSKDVLKTDPRWMEAAQALAADGGDIRDDWAVLMQGKELGLFKTALEIAAEQAENDELA